MERSEQPHLPADGSDQGSGAERGTPTAEAPLTGADGNTPNTPQPPAQDDPLAPEPSTETTAVPPGAPAHVAGLATRRPDPAALRHADRESRRWRRKRDYALTALAVIVLLVGGTTLWYFSDARGTVSRTAPAAPGLDTEGGLPGPLAPPTAVHEIWHAASDATPVPVVAKDSVVSADGSTVLGRDPITGAVRWEYARNWPLCTVNSAWGKAVTVYRKSNCSEVTELDGSTGERSGQRNDNADPGTRLITDGTHLAATGHTLVDVWRYDLVLTTQYGTIPDGVNPGSQPRTGCHLDSFAISNGRLGVLERCPDESGDRLTVLKTAPKDSDKPEPVFSTLIGGENRRLVAMSGDVEGVLTPGPARLVTFDATGAQHGEYPLDVPDADLQHGPADGVSGTTTGTKAIYWFSGSATVALSITDLHPLWTIRGALGPGTLIGGKLLVPVSGGLAVIDPDSGNRERLIPVDRHGYQGVIKMSSAGDVLLEQRGNALYALR